MNFLKVLERGFESLQRFSRRFENGLIIKFLNEANSGGCPVKTIDEIKKYCVEAMGLICHVDKKTLNNLVRDYWIKEIIEEKDGKPCFRYQITAEGQRLAKFLEEYGDFLSTKAEGKGTGILQVCPFLLLTL